MLRDLVVEGLGVIDRVELTLEPGCTALTGETGAGKTLVVAALSLLLGGRADRTLVRSGRDEAVVEARFLVPGAHPAAAALAEAGLVEPAAEPVEVVMSRSVSGDGRPGRVRVNGRLATVGLLADVGPLLVEIAGQHEQARLSVASQQRHLLDAYAGATDAAREVAALVARLAEARRTLAALEGGERERRRELDVLRFEIEEIESAGLAGGEVAELTAEADRLEHAEAIAASLTAAVEVLHGERGVDELLARARGHLLEVARRDPVAGDLAARVERVAIEITDVAEEARARVVAPDPDALAQVRARLDVLGRLRRKYGDDEAEILAYLARARGRAAEIELADGRIERLREEVRALEGAAEGAAAELASARRAAAPGLEQGAADLLDRLALPGARVEVRLDERPLYEGGVDAVELLLAANPGEPPRPLVKVASGGELSRAALALHLLTRAETAPTLVFDEVDAGVGGEAAHAVGRALARLAAESGCQVLVVTHLPQVAAFAEHHFAVRKQASDGRSVAVVERVRGDERVAELSRMLAGLPGSRRAREHARELLQLSGPHT